MSTAAFHLNTLLLDVLALLNQELRRFDFPTKEAFQPAPSLANKTCEARTPDLLSKFVLLYCCQPTVFQVPGLAVVDEDDGAWMLFKDSAPTNSK